MAIFLRLFMFYLMFTIIPMQSYMRKARDARERQAQEIQINPHKTQAQCGTLSNE